MDKLFKDKKIILNKTSDDKHKNIKEKKSDLVEKDVINGKVKENIENEIDEELLKDLKKVKFGDIIIANRYVTEKDKDKIPEGHKAGPMINNKYYHSDFTAFNEIEKSDEEYKIIDLALDSDMDEISKIRKQIKVNRKRNENQQVKTKVYKDFVPGDVIKTKTLSDDEYIIIKRDNEIAYSILFDEWNIDKPRLYHFEVGFIRKSYYNKLKDNEQVIEEKLYKLTKAKKTRII